MIVIDMDMPKDCGKCKLLMQCKGYYYIENKLPDTCPIKCDIEQIRDEIADLKWDDYLSIGGFKKDVLQIIDKYR